MLTKLDIEDLQGHTLSLPLQPATPGYLIKEIEGLDPVKANVVSSEFAQLDGSQYQSSRRENRNIILRIGLEPYFAGGSTVSDLRSALYSYFMPKNWVNLKFFIDGTLAYTIQGTVESCESSLFSKDPEVTVSIICFDPNFLAPSSTTVNGTTVSTSAEQTITIPSTVEVGYLLTMNVNRSITGFSIYNRRPDGSIAQLDLALSLLSGDVVKISTEPKSKYATLTRSGVTSSILYAVSASSKWGPLWPGDNFFRVLLSGTTIPFTILYTDKYGGL